MDPAETRALIASARDLIADPKHWCQHLMAKDANGKPTSARSPLAVQWCADGALWRWSVTDADKLPQEANRVVDKVVEQEYRDQTWTLILGNLPHQKPFTRLWHVNDKLGHAAVLHIFDLALA